MSEHEEDDLLRGLSSHDLDARSIETIRARAHAELERAVYRKRSAHWAWRAYRRAEPILAGALAASYLFWAFKAVLP